MKGYNGTIFAYGQTGSGKTHTMFGASDSGKDDGDGIIPRCASYIFDQVGALEDVEEMTVSVSFLEVYREKIRDLLSPSQRSLKIREDKKGNVTVEGLDSEYCTNQQDLLDIIEVGIANRTVAATNMNEVSSRSHSVVIIEVAQKLTDQSRRVGRLNLADLAGSERLDKSQVEGQQLKETQKINQSLSALGNCIFALTDKSRSHVPFRDSKLTYLLKVRQF